MAIYRNGIMGAFSGKVGTVIGSSWRGIAVMKSIPTPSKKRPSLLQTRQRLKMKVVVDWILPMIDWINIGYQCYSEVLTPYNGMVKYHMNHAIAGEGAEVAIDFPNAILSMGMLQGPCLPEVARDEQQNLLFTWQNNQPSKVFSSGKDEATVIVYNPVKEQFVYLSNAGIREEGFAVLQLPADYADDDLHCWLSFVSADGLRVSTSVYIA